MFSAHLQFEEERVRDRAGVRLLLKEHGYVVMMLTSSDLSFD